MTKHDRLGAKKPKPMKHDYLRGDGMTHKHKYIRTLTPEQEKEVEKLFRDIKPFKQDPVSDDLKPFRVDCATIESS